MQQAELFLDSLIVLSCRPIRSARVVLLFQIHYCQLA